MLRLRAPITRASLPTSRALPARMFSSAPSRRVPAPSIRGPTYVLAAPKVPIRKSHVIARQSKSNILPGACHGTIRSLLEIDASLNLQFPLFAAAAAALLQEAEAEAEVVVQIIPPAPALTVVSPNKQFIIPEPFRESRRMNWYEYSKLAIGVLYLIPIRLTLSIPLFATAWCLAKLSILGLRDEDLSKPRATWRRLLLRPLPYIVRAAMFIFGFYCIHTHGQIATGSLAPIVVSNHLSFLDPVVLMSIFPESNFVSKREIASVPFFGTFVNRESDSSRRSAIAEITSRTTAHASDYPQLLIFPEGTTTNGTSVIEFRHGAFQPGLPVQPLVIRYPNSYCDPASPRAGQGIVLKFLRVASQFVNHLDVTFLPVYKPSEQEASNPTQYAENVRKVIATAASATLAPYTYFDAIKYARM